MSANPRPLSGEGPLASASGGEGSLSLALPARFGSSGATLAHPTLANARATFPLAGEGAPITPPCAAGRSQLLHPRRKPMSALLMVDHFLRRHPIELDGPARFRRRPCGRASGIIARLNTSSVPPYGGTSATGSSRLPPLRSRRSRPASPPFLVHIEQHRDDLGLRIRVDAAVLFVT